LPDGWYPGDDVELRRLVASWKLPERDGEAISAIAPHAGWLFSGSLAARAIKDLARAETVVVIGGHLSEGKNALAAFDEGFETPLGSLDNDLELLDRLAKEVFLSPDLTADNTVEIQLPLVVALLAPRRVLWLRAPNGKAAMALGESLYRASRDLGRRITVLGSTDLTHYGPDYGFEPRGRGAEALRWVRDINDKSFIDALLSFDAAGALSAGNERGAACSSGAAAAALAFTLSYAKGEGKEPQLKSSLLAYATSHDVRPASSFVGYCALAYYAGARP